MLVLTLPLPLLQQQFGLQQRSLSSHAGTVYKGPEQPLILNFISVLWPVPTSVFLLH